MTYAECLGPLDQEVTTMDLLKRIELRMEFLTQNLERLPLEKVKIAQRVSDNGFPQCWTVGAIFTFGRSRSHRIKNVNVNFTRISLTLATYLEKESNIDLT